MRLATGRPVRATVALIAAMLGWHASEMATVCAQPIDPDPEKIKIYLMNNPTVDTADKFLKNLPAEFKKDWIMMTQSESSQKGTASKPRFIVPSADAKNVFAFLPGTNVIEYMNFDSGTKKFRFHEIEMRGGNMGGAISIDDASCPVCHASTRNGVRGAGPRPNWDAYDSWAGALPFNRDRVYEHAKVNDANEESLELTAIKRIFKNLKVTGDPIYLALTEPPDGELPKGVTQHPTTHEVSFAFVPCDGATFGEHPCKTDNGNGVVGVKFDQLAKGVMQFPGASGPVSVTQGGKYLRFKHTTKADINDEGRGVALFDALTPMNAKRVAEELANFPTNPVDIRYVALAIVNQCVTAATLGKFAPKEAFAKLLTFHKNLDPTGTADPNFPTGNIDDFPKLLADTRKRMENLPRLKASLQSTNLRSQLLANNNARCTANATPYACCTGAGAGTCQSIDNAVCTAAAVPLACCTGAGTGTCDFTSERIVSNIARRSVTNPPPGPFRLDATGTKFMIDREFYDPATNPPSKDELLKLALFRLYLEPLGVAVDSWSMSIKKSGSLSGRNRTYTFGDLFAVFYIGEIDTTLRAKLGYAPAPTPICGDLATKSIKEFVKL